MHFLLIPLIYRYTVPDAVLQKLSELDTSIFGDFEVQTVQDAAGSVVNMDYFPIKLDMLPYKPNSNQRYTADEFLNHIRTNINSFIDTDLSSFSPSTITGTNEAALWNSANALGSIIHINIPPPAGDGSVICSHHSQEKWIFTTIEVPWRFTQEYDGEHPVSGNREFGYTANSDGSYTFYTRGVDRITDPLEALAAGAIKNPFEIPDKLWNSFKDGIYNFVNQNGGSSDTTNVKNSIDRVDWEKIRDVLDGNRPIGDLGCK